MDKILIGRIVLYDHVMFLKQCKLLLLLEQTLNLNNVSFPSC